jgi:E3 ubiquitin ligase SMURF1/2/E3 ubiquitin-protein ligase NEDD4
MKGFEKIHISRQDFFFDSMQKILAMDTQQLRSEFQIEFLGEKSQDAGGLTKEWLNLLIAELLSENFNVFRLAHTGEQRYKITQNSLDPDFYILSGKIIGKALLENIPINCPLSFLVLKYILDIDITHDDIKYIDSDVHRAVEFIKNNSIKDVIYETFSVSDEYGKVYELLPDGRFMDVNDENKELYIDLRLEYELNTSILSAVAWLKEGIFSVFPKEFVAGLTPEELDQLICGNPVVNLYEWKMYTEYRGEFNDGHMVVKWFWQVLDELSQEDLRGLLMFVTGTDRVPVGGFQNLKTTRGEPARFTLEPFPYSRAALPRAHTCFNRMDLPLYKNKAEMKRSIVEVIKNHTFGFGLE